MVLLKYDKGSILIHGEAGTPYGHWDPRVGAFRALAMYYPEILAYFYGGLAGGIISVAIIKNHFSTDKAASILLDVGELLLIGFGFLIVAAIFEVFLTPTLF